MSFTHFPFLIKSASIIWLSCRKHRWWNMRRFRRFKGSVHLKHRTTCCSNLPLVNLTKQIVSVLFLLLLLLLRGLNWRKNPYENCLQCLSVNYPEQQGHWLNIDSNPKISFTSASCGSRDDSEMCLKAQEKASKRILT